MPPGPGIIRSETRLSLPEAWESSQSPNRTPDELRRVLTAASGWSDDHTDVEITAVRFNGKLSTHSKLRFLSRLCSPPSVSSSR